MILILKAIAGVLGVICFSMFGGGLFFWTDKRINMPRKDKMWTILFLILAFVFMFLMCSCISDRKIIVDSSGTVREEEQV